MGQFLAAAHRIEVAAQRGAGLDEPCNQREQPGDIDHQRKAQQAVGQQAAKHIVVDLDDTAAGQQHGRPGGDKPHRKAGHEGRDAQLDMDQAVDHANRRANQQNQRQGDPAACRQSAAELDEGIAEQHGGERQRPLHRQINRAHQDDERHTDRDHQRGGCGDSDAREIAQRKELGLMAVNKITSAISTKSGAQRIASSRVKRPVKSIPPLSPVLRSDLAVRSGGRRVAAPGSAYL